MPEFFDYDPMTGIKTEFDYDESTGNAHFHQSADVSTLLDYTNAMRNDSLSDKGIKEGWWLYAKIPPIVMLKMRNKGIIVEDGRDINRVIAELNTYYPNLKVTQKNEGKKLALIHDYGKR